MAGEEIDIQPPYITVTSYGILNTSNISGNTREDVKGFRINTYSINRGLNESMMSDFLDMFTMVNANGIVIEDITQNSVLKLDTFYEGTLNMVTRNTIKRI